MSRHKLVKQLDIDDELDTYDGGNGYDDDDNGTEISIEDKEQLQQGTIRVRSALGPDVPVTDQEIQEALWHYYYDIGKTVGYILGQKTASKARRTKKKNSDPAPVISSAFVPSNTPACAALCSGRSVTAHFFEDAPWFNIPAERQAEILIEPLYPPGRLLGGSSAQSNGKMSKLAALAATRRKKENPKSESESSSVTNSVALLDRLGTKKPHEDSSTFTATSEAPAVVPKSSTQVKPHNTSRRYPIRKRHSLDQASQEKQNVPEEFILQNKGSYSPPEATIVPVAPPSAFARTIFGNRPELAELADRDTIISDPLRPASYNLHSVHAKFDAFAGPSPDDVVLKAQGSKGTKITKSKHEKEINEVSKVVSNTAISEAPKARSKNLNVIAEFQKRKAKPAANFVVIGHVDAGKSTLMGRLLYDLRVVDQRTLDRYRKEADSIGKSSFALAWVLDQGTDERSQGVTIDIGMNKFETDKTAFTILDAPGHRDFIPNMIAGASQADFAVLVIDASTGSFESGLKGQTKEHALLVRSMGVQRVIIAVNKLDTLAWSRDRFEEIQQQVAAFLTVAGFQPKNLAFLPCSGLTGDNIVRPATDTKASWYSGPPLITLLESSEPFARALEKPLRLSIDDIFRGGVQNPLSISGRIEAGSVQLGDVVVTIPCNETASIKGIEVDSEANDWAVAGQNVILHLADIDPKYLKTGDIICPPSAPIRSLSKFTMKILAFEHLLPMAVEVHKGRLHAPGRVAALIAVLDKASGKPVEGGKKKVKIVKPGSVARVVVEVDEPVPLEVGGKVVLRAGGQTVGAGLLE